MKSHTFQNEKHYIMLALNIYNVRIAPLMNLAPNLIFIPIHAIFIQALLTIKKTYKLISSNGNI